MKKSFSGSLIASMTLHTLILTMILLSAQHSSQLPPRDKLLSVELQTTSTDSKTEKDIRSKAKTPPKPKTRLVDVQKDSSEPPPPSKGAGEVVHSQLPKNQALEESDLGSLTGQIPKNSAESYLFTLREQISRHKSYPQAARAFGEQGLVRLRLTLNRNGSVVKIEILEPSPYRRLNDAAMKSVTKAAPFAAFPQNLDIETWRIQIPIRFTL